MKTTRLKETISGFDVGPKSNKRAHFSESPKCSITNTSASKLKMRQKNVPKLSHKNTVSMPSIAKQYQKNLKRGKKRIDQTRSKHDIVNSFGLVEELTKKQKAFV